MRPIFGLSSCAARSRISDALAARLVASPESGPPGSPNLSPRISVRASLVDPLLVDPRPFHGPYLAGAVAQPGAADLGPAGRLDERRGPQRLQHGRSHQLPRSLDAASKHQHLGVDPIGAAD